MQRSGWSALGTGLAGGLQWRLLICWVLLTLIPTLVASLPILSAFSSMLDYSVHADEWAQHFDALMFRDVAARMGDLAPVHGAIAAGVVLSLLISPLLSGMVVASARAGRSLSFTGLLQGAGAEYWRMFRTTLVSLVVYVPSGFLAMQAMKYASDRSETALLQSDADLAGHVALGVALLCIVLAQCIAESARAQFMVDMGLRSAWRALWRGLLQFLRRPFATLGSYLVISIVGFGLAALIASWRGHTTAVGVGLLVAFLITQLGVVVVGWMRTARLYALAAVAQPAGARRRRTDFAPAL
ncbi:hypothetical protein FHW69_003570 [Luteibacter sp. Sphag1AF]|uniref:hypothetical protein n=1 Tax=Luteibacter sp. Sphag1AF TaxID=2587031 RepID=UPI001610FECA|nr:hypothetical protein [Luteibacter sp. Sphag1AF]MBB3228922.1 hypothetical protein [Luteibacter sp. Sphag1AF]